MRIAIIGTRGIPARYGGFETFAEELSRRLVKSGIKVTVYCEKNNYFRKSSYCGVELTYSKYLKSSNPIFYYYESIKDGIRSSDLILVAGVGGAIFYPILKKRQAKIITNIDGIEYLRGKWSILKRLYIKLCEKIAISYSDRIVADSIGIKNHLIARYRNVPRKVSVIEYGAYVNHCFDKGILEKHSIKHNKYYLIVSRLEPENNILMIIKGYRQSNSEKPLIVVGSMVKSSYARKLLDYQSDRIRFIGGIFDKKELHALRYSCFAYLHGHSVGGTNPSLLEALGSRNLTICYDNVFNREVTASDMYYFKNSDEIAKIINDIEGKNFSYFKEKKDNAEKRIANYYNWDLITKKYIDLLSA